MDMHKKFNTDIKRLFCIKPFRCVPIYLKTSNSVAAFWCCSNLACKSFDSFNHLWDSLAFVIHSVIFFTLYPCLLGTFFSPEQHSLLSNLKTQGSGNSEFFSPILSSSHGNGILGNDSTFIRPCVIQPDSWGFVWFLRLFNCFLMPHRWASWQKAWALPPLMPTAGSNLTSPCPPAGTRTLASPPDHSKTYSSLLSLFFPTVLDKIGRPALIPLERSIMWVILLFIPLGGGGEIPIVLTSEPHLNPPVPAVTTTLCTEGSLFSSCHELPSEVATL